jgi:hypothetical protein
MPAMTVLRLVVDLSVGVKQVTCSLLPAIYFLAIPGSESERTGSMLVVPTRPNKTTTIINCTSRKILTYSRVDGAGTGREIHRRLMVPRGRGRKPAGNGIPCLATHTDATQTVIWLRVKVPPWDVFQFASIQ